MRTTAVITVYNRPEMALACLRALALNTARIDEAVVADDGSTPENVAKFKAGLAGLPFPVQYYWQPDDGYRLAAARNQAIRHAAGDYLLMLDCDILLLPETVALHLACARRGQFVAANRALLGEAESRRILAAPLEARSLEEFWQKADRSHLPRAERQFRRNVWLRRFGLARRNRPKILGCHFSIFREDVERINGFDENFVGWGLEDDDFAMRLHMAGVKGVSLITKARALHLWHPSQATAHPSQSPNYDYYRRRHVVMFCRRGLKQ